MPAYHIMQHLPIKEIPNCEGLEKIWTRYPDLDADATILFMHILRAGDEAFRAASETFKHHCVSHGRFIVMMNLFDKENGVTHELSAAEIADRSCVTRATVTGLVDGLEKEGIVVRFPDPKDRRMVVVKLTQAGIDLMDNIMPMHFRMMRRLMSVFSAEEKKQLLQLLEKLNQWIGEVVPNDDSATTCEGI